MKITVQITVRSDEGEAEVVQEVAHLERGPLQPETLGLSLAEARSILAGLEQTMVQRQATEFVTQERRCPRCGRERSSKDCQSIVFRTPFGKLKRASPRLYRCSCERQDLKSFSPLAQRLPERTSPELLYLETKFAALVSYGLTLKLLNEVLPVGQDLSTTAIRQHVRHTAERLDSELGDGKDVVLENNPREASALPELTARRSSDWMAPTSTPQANAREPKGGLRSSSARASPSRIDRGGVSGL